MTFVIGVNNNIKSYGNNIQKLVGDSSFLKNPTLDVFCVFNWPHFVSLSIFPVYIHKFSDSFEMQRVNLVSWRLLRRASLMDYSISAFCK